MRSICFSNKYIAHAPLEFTTSKDKIYLLVVCLWNPSGAWGVFISEVVYINVHVREYNTFLLFYNIKLNFVTNRGIWVVVVVRQWEIVVKSFNNMYTTLHYNAAQAQQN
jgi:hypothetical protein